LIADVIAKELNERDLNNMSGKQTRTFYVSHDSDFFNHTAQQFFPGDIKLQTYPLWD